VTNLAEPLADQVVEFRASLRETARSVLGNRVGPGGRQRLRHAAAGDDVLFAELATLGWLSLEVSEDRDGLGAGFAEVAVLVEELGRELAPVPFTAATLGIAAVLAGPAHLQDLWLQELLEGSSVMTVALCDRTGAPGETGITATRAGEDWHLTGSAMHVLDLPRAQAVAVSARAADSTVVAIVRTDQQGVQCEAQATVDVSRSFGMLTLDLTVTTDVLIAGPPDGVRVAAALADRAAIALAADALGGAETVLGFSLAYLRERRQFGRPIGSFQAIKHRCADMYVAVEASRSAVEAAAAESDAGDGGQAASIAKAHTTEAFLAVCEEAIQMHGGIGVTWEHDLHLYLKRALLSRALFGATDWHRDRIAALELDRNPR
jgi:alkylation response protein AidB-like acyl-CoA dehydrogenase